MTTENHDAVIAGPNFLNNEFFDVVLSGGHWSSDNPIANLKTELLSEVAQSASAGASATIVDVDLGTLRDIKFIGYPNSNASRDGRVRVLISQDPSFSRLRVFGSTGVSATSLTVLAGRNTTIRVGDVFSMADQRDADGNLYTYKFAAGTTLVSGTTGTLALASPTQMAVAGNASIICHTGDFTTAVVSSVYNGDWEDWWNAAYTLETQSWPLESWDGKLTDEQAQHFPRQWFKVFSTSVLGQYVRTIIEDTTNADGYLELAELFISGGWYGDVYLELGASLGYQSTTTMGRSKSNAKHFNRGVEYRQAVFTVPNVATNPAMQSAQDLVKRVGLHRQVYLVLDVDDAANRHRLCFIGHLSRLDPQVFVNFDANNVPFSVEEDTEGDF